MAYVNPNPVLTGSWQAVAGAGNATVTATEGYGNVEWACGASLPPESYRGGIIRDSDDRAFLVPAGEQLYLRGHPGYVITLDREVAPA